MATRWTDAIRTPGLEQFSRLTQALTPYPPPFAGLLEQVSGMSAIQTAAELTSRRGAFSDCEAKVKRMALWNSQEDVIGTDPAERMKAVPGGEPHISRDRGIA